MGVAKNPSDQAVVGQGVKLYTGISEFNVLAVNPSLKELNDLGIMLQKEPQYEVTFDSGPVTKIVFWLGNSDVKVSCEFLVTPGPWTSKNGKVKCYNAIGQNQWLPVGADGKFDTSDCPEWIKDKSSFYAIPKGLDKVTEFVRAWANVADGDEISLDTIPAIEKGNVKELKDLIVALKNNQVRALVFVRDEKYQSVYTEHFGRVTPKRDDLFIKAMSGEYGQVKGDYTIPWQEYVPGVPAPDSVTNTVEDDWQMPDSPLGGGDIFEDDPFK